MKRKNNIKGWAGNKTNWKKINNNLGKILAALVSLSYYDFKLIKKDECVEIDILSLAASPYRYIRVYDNLVGYSELYDSGKYFEGMAYRKSTIIMDILAKD